MKYKLLVPFLLCLSLTGCHVGDKYDGLKVIDGQGRILILKHNFCDNYFISQINDVKTENAKINEDFDKNFHVK